MRDWALKELGKAVGLMVMDEQRPKGKGKLGIGGSEGGWGRHVASRWQDCSGQEGNLGWARSYEPRGRLYLSPIQ